MKLNDSTYGKNSSSNINTPEYWNNRFQSGNWDDCRGVEQSQAFAELLIENLPDDIKYNIKESVDDGFHTMLDFGCAKGQLCNEWFSYFDVDADGVFGIDISGEALMQASRLYAHKNYNFGLIELNKSISKQLTQFNNSKFHTICCSNVLEHVNTPIAYLQLLASLSSKYVIIMVPVEDTIYPNGEHVSMFSKYSFPVRIGDGNFVCTHTVELDASSVPNCGDKQLLVVYSKRL